MTITKSSYVSKTHLQRVAEVFEHAGLRPPQPDTPDGGAYASNVLTQYPQMRENVVLAMLEGWHDPDDDEI